MSTVAAEDVPQIFLRLKEPLYIEHAGVTFEYPENFLSQDEQKIATSLKSTKISTTPYVATSTYSATTYSTASLSPPVKIPKVITVEDFKGAVPDLTKAKDLPRNVNFCIFDEAHREAANDLIRIFMDAPVVDFYTTIIYARDKVNPYLFVYAASVAMLHRRREPGIKGLTLPSHVSIFPHLYIQGDAFGPAYEEAVLPEYLRKPVEIPMNHTANDLDIEHRVAYWREDIGLNMHHWHWHVVYPHSSDSKYVNVLVNKSRRGELFYYMHQQIVARYNFERLCNRLARVRRFDNFRTPIPEGYFPKLNSTVASRGYPSRQPYSLLNNLKRNIKTNSKFTVIDIYDMEMWRDRIIDAVHKGFYLAKDESGETKITPWKEETGIDILGNIVEATVLSVNKGLYGDLHNAGHMMIAGVHDPDFRFQEDVTVMGNNATAMRDPLFYVWHAFVDDIFQKYKATLSPYTKEKLSFDGIKITNVQIKSDVQADKVNEFRTFWENSDVDVSGGLDGAAQGKVFVRWTHLQHDPFTYNIEVTNTGKEREGTIRIFLAPELDEAHALLRFEDQRKLFIELDKFTKTLPAGTSTIQQKSTDSSVTIPLKQLLGSTTNVFCGCGWPEHLLIPKGSMGGVSAILFVMISDAAEDAVSKTKVVPSDCGCEVLAPSYCGLDGLPYPDKKAMGYPFDRPSSEVYLNAFVKLAPNMFVQKTLIKFDASGSVQGQYNEDDVNA